MDILPMASLASETVTLARAMKYTLPKTTVFQNLDEHNPALAQLMDQQVYVERSVNLEAIKLYRFEELRVFGAAHYILATEAGAIKEHVPPWGEPSVLLQQALDGPAPEETISVDTVVITRFGWSTWGHWLGELLPKIVLVEQMYPGRFFYAVARAYEEAPWRSYAESIAAYGIAPQRLVLVDECKTYRFTHAWAVSSVWSDHVMHPQASETMRCMLRTGPKGAGARKVALIRRDADARSLDNWQDVAAALASEGYSFVDISDMHFWHQAQTFMDADAVFSVLGSGLTGVIYSPLGVNILSAAPSIFADRFFYALTTDRRAKYADVRGAIMHPDPVIPHRGSFRVEVDTIWAALAALG